MTHEPGLAGRKDWANGFASKRKSGFEKERVWRAKTFGIQEDALGKWALGKNRKEEARNEEGKGL
jgi:hypothetical protein